MCAELRFGGVRNARRSGGETRGNSFDMSMLTVNKDGESAVRNEYLLVSNQ